MSAREKFATQVNSEVLAAVRALAAEEGRQLQALVDEALMDLIEKRKQAKPRPHVMTAYLSSHDKYSELYKKLAEDDQVYIRRDPSTGDVILSRRPGNWDEYFALVEKLDIPRDFLADRGDELPQRRPPLE